VEYLVLCVSVLLLHYCKIKCINVNELQLQRIVNPVLNREDATDRNIDDQDRYDWVNIFFGTGSPGLSWTKPREPHNGSVTVFFVSDDQFLPCDVMLAQY